MGVFFSYGKTIFMQYLDEKALIPHLEAMPSATPKKYYGVTFVSRTIGPMKWRAQVVRQGMVISLGAYDSPEGAARAYDNASFHLANWGDQVPRYNFPAEWAVMDPPKISIYSTRALAKLKERFPNWERENVADESLSEFEKVQRDSLIAIDSVILNMNRCRTAILWSFGQLKLQDQKLKQHAEELEQRDRIIKGLRITGGKSVFTPVAAPAGPDNPSLEDPV